MFVDTEDLFWVTFNFWTVYILNSGTVSCNNWRTFYFKKIVFSNHYNIMLINAVELILKKSQMDVIVKLIQLYLDFFLFRNHLRLVKFYTSYWEPETVSRSWCCKYMLKYMDIQELKVFISDMFSVAIRLYSCEVFLYPGHATEFPKDWTLWRFYNFTECLLQPLTGMWPFVSVNVPWSEF